MEGETQQRGPGWTEPAEPVPGRRLVRSTQDLCADKAADYPGNFTMVTDSPWPGKEEGEQKRGTRCMLLVCTPAHP